MASRQYQLCSRQYACANVCASAYAFNAAGFVVVHQLVDDRNIAIYRDLCEQLLSGQIDASTHRHDLGAHVPRNGLGLCTAAAGRPVENTTQIMWPSLFFPDNLTHSPLRQRSMAVSAILRAAEPAAAHKEGQVAFDFDMVIDKAPHSNTPAPWHQDEAYWRKANLNFDDVRAASCWCSLDHATIDNGCTWFVPGSHLQPVAEHVAVKEGAHAIEAPEVAKSPDIIARAVPVPWDHRAGHLPRRADIAPHAGQCSSHASARLDHQPPTRSNGRMRTIGRLRSRQGRHQLKTGGRFWRAGRGDLTAVSFGKSCLWWVVSVSKERERIAGDSGETCA